MRSRHRPTTLLVYHDRRLDRFDDEPHRSAVEVGDRVSWLAELSAVAGVCLGQFEKLPCAVRGIP
jgi:hypothetical protein